MAGKQWETDIQEGKNILLSTINTGILPAGASMVENYWNDVSLFKTIAISISVNDLVTPSSAYVENQFSEDGINKQIFKTGLSLSNAVMGFASDLIYLNYFKTYVKNTDVVAQVFIVRRRAIIN